MRKHNQHKNSESLLSAMQGVQPRSNPRPFIVITKGKRELQLSNMLIVFIYYRITVSKHHCSRVLIRMQSAKTKFCLFISHSFFNFFFYNGSRKILKKRKERKKKKRKAVEE